MKRIRVFSLVCASASLVACSESNFPTNDCGDATTTNCVEVRGGDEEALLEAVNNATESTTIVMGEGTFELTSGLSFSVNGIHIVGQGIDETTISFSTATTQFHGINADSDDFLVQDFTMIDAPGHGIRVDSSVGVVYRRIRATWSEPFSSSNGAYGIYPVRCENVLVEDSRAESASDAGLYVGQCQHVIVRNNHVSGNVAGLEIENTQYADVYGNVAEENTAGIVVFDMQENPIVGRDVRIFDNIIRNNNAPNFAPGGTVEAIPAGTGTFALASRRVEITNNTYENNDTSDIAILSGLVLDGVPANWSHTTAELVGDWEDLGLLPDGAGGVLNFRTENIVISGNTFSGSGTYPDTTDPGMLGFLLSLAFPARDVPSILYDSIMESTFDAADVGANSNDNHICLGGNTDASFASLDLMTQQMSATPPEPILVVRDGVFGAFNCTALNGAPIVPVVLASAGN